MSSKTTSEKLQQSLADGAAAPDMVQNPALGTVRERSLTQLQEAISAEESNRAVKRKNMGLRFRKRIGPATC